MITTGSRGFCVVSNMARQSDGAREWRTVPAPLTMHPHPGRRTVKIAQRRLRPGWRSMLVPGLPIGKIGWIEVVGFAAHDSESDRKRRSGSQPLDLVPE
jgi:hypothetical protein